MASKLASTSDGRGPSKSLKISLAIAVALVAAIAMDTKVVVVGSKEDARQEAFNPDNFGQEQFPRIRAAVISKAPAAVLLAEKLADNKKAAVKEFGTMAGAFPVLPVHVTGMVGKGASGIFNVTVEGLPEGTKIRVQTGPAINGTELRDITGDIEFGKFKNQIEYQDAGAGINRAMSSQILGDLDRDALTGKVIDVVGVFKLINPKNWLVTPVSLEIKP